MEKHILSLSRTLSFVLRHKPESFGLNLDSQGWVLVEDLLNGFADKKLALTFDLLKEIVDTDDKGRYAFSEDGLSIRAVQGHSCLQVKINHKQVIPTSNLYHGTATKNLPDIMKMGLLPQRRHHVHLSKDVETAKQVGSRHGKVVVLELDCQAMIADGVVFYLADNDVYLVDKVDAKYLKIHE